MPAGQVAAAILLIAGIARPLFLGEIYTEPDLRTFHLVFRFFYAEMLAGGQDFLWSGPAPPSMSAVPSTPLAD